MGSKAEIPLSGSSLNIVKKCGWALRDLIHGKFGCEVTFNNVDFESDASIAQQKKPTLVPQKILSAMLNNGVEVSVWKADLTNLQVDAVVNAANMHLQHYGGLALALSEAGGLKIQKDSDDYIKKHKELETGKAIIADAGLLPCKKIIHAVGPQLARFHPNVSKAEPLLKEAIKSILDLVYENCLDTVAIPAISSGLFNYPLDKCAETIVSTVKKYYDIHLTQGHYPKEIQLVNNDEPTVRAMEKACNQILLSQTTMSYSQAAGSRSRGAAKTSTPAVKIGNVTLTLKKGKIEEQMTDVIVNTVSRERILSLGEISCAILKKAGPEMQKEIDSASWSSYVISTKSYKLPCNEVYHTCFTETVQNTVQQNLYNAVSECLWKAAAKGYKSISFPAIGTGKLSLRKEEVAATMSNAVSDFAQNTQYMMDVFFVIYAFDSTFKAFDKQMQCLCQKVSSPSFTSAIEHREYFRDTKPPSPQISLIARSDEATLEAERWLSDLLFKPCRTVHISNNFIQHFGEEEYQQLSRLTQTGVSIEESFMKGHACITVMGSSHEDVVFAGLQVEAMLLNIQKTFVTEEENIMLNALGQLPTTKVGFERRKVNHTGPLFSDISLHSKHRVLKVVKAEEVNNPALEMMYNLKKKQLDVKPQRMFQCIPAQFCEMVCHTGFHAEYAPPDDPAFGEGIYFARSVEAAMELWKEQNEKFVYLVEADVLTGVSTRGEPGLILPPARGTDPLIRYDSVHGGNDIAVIFSTYQARPKHIITCKLVKSDSSIVSSKF